VDEKHVLSKLKDAKQDRMLAQGWLNECLRFARPLSNKVGHSVVTPRNPDIQDDLFDTTLQDTVDDFGSDMTHLFTPRHERWVRFEPTDDLSDGEKKQIEGEIDAEAKAVFSEIERSNFYEAAGEAYRDWSISVMAVSISDPGVGKSIDCQPIELSSLLLSRGPLGTFDGRFREWPAMKRAEAEVIFNGFIAKSSELDGKKTVHVIDGWCRDWSDPTIEAWYQTILVNNKVEYMSKLGQHVGPGSCGFIVCPWRKAFTTSWMPGPAYKALPPARTLDELAYLYLKALNRDVDPVVSYVDDGIMNVEGGIDAGTWLPRGANSDAPEAIASNARLDAAVFERDKLERKVKKALYQDRPDQTGKTPPTATQWVDEKAWNTRRMELPRDLATNNWVLPIINRFTYLRALRGQDLGVTLNKQFVQLRPVTPLSKARDLEDIQTTMQVINMALPLLQLEQAGNPIDARGTIENLQKTSNERHLVLKSEEQIAQEQAMAMMQQGGMSPDGSQDVPTA
jgi:hypothetical protein